MSVGALRSRLPARILVHTATPVSYEEQEGLPVSEWIEGEPGAEGGGEPVDGESFACVLFMPAPGGQQQGAAARSRVVLVPTLMYNPTRNVTRAGLVADGSAIVIGPEDELRIDAPELVGVVGVNPGRWLVQGDPQPLGPPGTVIGMQASLEMVRD